MDDLAAWLTQIWDEQEKTLLQITHEGDRPHWPGCQFLGDVPGYCNCDLTEQMLARITADRQILSRLRALEVESHEQWLDYTDWIDGAHSRTHRERQHTEQEIAEIPGLIYALKCSALPYADRPGYQEAWKPE